MVKLRDLQYLVAVEQYRHFSQAAKSCSVSQPTLSGQLQKLEQQLGIQLIERHSRKVMITNQGKVIIEKAKLVLQKVEEFEQTAQHLLDPLNTKVNMGIIPTVGPYLMPHIMPSINQALPNTQFYLHEEKTKILMSDLKDGRLDCVILPKIEHVTGVEYYQLYDEELLLTISPQHTLNKQSHIEFTDLKTENLLTLSDGHCLKQQVLEYCFYQDNQEDFRFQATSLETLRHMVAANLGITLMPKLATIGGFETNRLKYISLQKGQPSRQVVLAVRDDFHNIQLIRTIVRTIKESYRALNIDLLGACQNDVA